jgi:hypothetical protein
VAKDSQNCGECLSWPTVATNPQAFPIAGIAFTKFNGLSIPNFSSDDADRRLPSHS